MKEITPYRQRPIRFLDLWEFDGWRMKAYGIAVNTERPDSVLVEAARSITQARLAESAGRTHHYGIGFTGVHQGLTANFVFVDWWADENELHHHVYVSPLHDPKAFAYMTPTGLSACTWDLYVLAFERDAWVDTVLNNPDGPSLDAYLSRHLNEDV